MSMRGLLGQPHRSLPESWRLETLPALPLRLADHDQGQDRVRGLDCQLGDLRRWPAADRTRGHLRKRECERARVRELDRIKINKVCPSDGLVDDVDAAIG